MKSVLVAAMILASQFLEGATQPDLSKDIYTYYTSCSSGQNFSHFAALYDTLSVEENWDSKNGLPEAEGIAATNLIDAFPDKVIPIFASGKAEAWKVCVGKIHERIRKEREAQYLRDAKKQSNCVKSIADDFISNGALGEVEDFRKCFYKI